MIPLRILLAVLLLVGAAVPLAVGVDLWTATWTVKLKASLPRGARTLTVAVDPLDPRTLYTGT